MRLDLLLVNHPSQNCRGAVIGVADQSVGSEIKAIFNPLNHRLGGVDLIDLVGGCRLNVDHNSRGNVDQIVRRIGVERRSTRGTPLRGRIGQRDILRRVLFDLSLIQCCQVFAHRATDGLSVWPVGLSTGHATLAVGASAFTKLASMANPSPPTSPSRTQRSKTCSNTNRSVSLSRNRPCRFFENVEWSGT